MKAFDRLHPALQHHIVNSLGWRDLREVQSLSIDAYLDGNNMVVLAPTAGGKTESAFFPVMSQMLEESWEGISVLVRQPDQGVAEQSRTASSQVHAIGRTASRFVAWRYSSR